MVRIRTGKPIEWLENENGCHVCTSHSKDKNGYVKLKRSNRSWQMHRYIYTQHHGEIPKGLVVMHTCDNPTCINIEHLTLGTCKDNTKDMHDKGRYGKNAGKKSKPIAEKNIKAIRLEKGLTAYQIAEESDICLSYYFKIEGNRTNGSIATLSKIAKSLGVNINQIFKEERMMINVEHLNLVGEITEMIYRAKEGETNE